MFASAIHKGQPASNKRTIMSPPYSESTTLPPSESVLTVRASGDALSRRPEQGEKYWTSTTADRHRVPRPTPPSELRSNTMFANPTHESAASVNATTLTTRVIPMEFSSRSISSMPDSYYNTHGVNKTNKSAPTMNTSAAAVERDIESRLTTLLDEDDDDDVICRDIREVCGDDQDNYQKRLSHKRTANQSFRALPLPQGPHHHHHRHKNQQWPLYMSPIPSVFPHNRYPRQQHPEGDHRHHCWQKQQHHDFAAAAGCAPARNFYSNINNNSNNKHDYHYAPMTMTATTNYHQPSLTSFVASQPPLSHLDPHYSLNACAYRYSAAPPSIPLSQQASHPSNHNITVTSQCSVGNHRAHHRYPKDTNYEKRVTQTQMPKQAPHSAATDSTTLCAGYITLQSHHAHKNSSHTTPSKINSNSHSNSSSICTDDDDHEGDSSSLIVPSSVSSVSSSPAAAASSVSFSSAVAQHHHDDAETDSVTSSSDTKIQNQQPERAPLTSLTSLVVSNSVISSPTPALVSSTVSGLHHTALAAHGLAFVPFPTEEELACFWGYRTGLGIDNKEASTTTRLAYSPRRFDATSHVKVFMGQMPHGHKKMPPERVAWLFATFANNADDKGDAEICQSEGEEETTSAPARLLEAIHVDVYDAIRAGRKSYRMVFVPNEAAFRGLQQAMHERLLLDNGGVWHARTAGQQAALALYCGGTTTPAKTTSRANPNGCIGGSAVETAGGEERKKEAACSSDVNTTPQHILSTVSDGDNTSSDNNGKPHRVGLGFAPRAITIMRATSSLGSGKKNYITTFQF